MLADLVAGCDPDAPNALSQLANHLAKPTHALPTDAHTDAGSSHQHAQQQQLITLQNQHLALDEPPAHLVPPPPHRTTPHAPTQPPINAPTHAPTHAPTLAQTVDAAPEHLASDTWNQSAEIAWRDAAPPDTAAPRHHPLPTAGMTLPQPPVDWAIDSAWSRAHRPDESHAAHVARETFRQLQSGDNGEMSAAAWGDAVAASLALAPAEAEAAARRASRMARHIRPPAPQQPEWRGADVDWYPPRVESVHGGQAAVEAPQADALERAWEESAAAAATSSLDGLHELWDALGNADEGGTQSLREAWEEAAERELDEYEFQANNPYLGQSGLLERGRAMFERGQLSEAILALEAFVQAEPQHSVAWQTLGQAHADADDDRRAIACLRRAVAADASNLDALLALGVSYTNELDESRALDHLRRWIDLHPSFCHLGGSSRGGSSGESATQARMRLASRFEGAAAVAPSSADVQLVLGVLYNLSREYSRAAAAFERAIELSPMDYSLWNKLGATKANGMSFEAAVPCYVRALELKPQYVRALTNLGISYGNMLSHEASAQCYLEAISLNPGAEHVWSYIPMALSSMGRSDLIGKLFSSDRSRPPSWEQLQAST